MYNEIKKEILVQLRRDTNGAVVGTMFEMLGSERYINYGVSIPAIKKVAREYAPNHALAQCLFDSQIRELKLCAVYVDASEDVTAAQMETWSEAFDNVEILEHCCSMLFYGANDALTVAKEWLQVRAYAALLMAGKRAKTHYLIQERDQYMKILDEIETLPDTGLVFKGKCIFLASLAKSDADFCEYILKMPLSERIMEEISWQIEIN